MGRRSVWRLVLLRLLVVGGAVSGAFLAGFRAGPDLLGQFASWAAPRVSGWDMGVQVVGWLGELGPVETATTAAGLVLTAGTAWALRPHRERQAGQKLDDIAQRLEDAVDSIRRAAGPVADVGAAPKRLVFGAIPQRAAWFQRRATEQQALADALAGSEKAVLVALPGARGAGKTQLAAVYARACVEDGFDLVAWINAEGGPVNDLASLGAALGLNSAESAPDQVAAQAIRAISADDDRRRLIVFDNVDDPESVALFLPVTGAAKVIVTTNRREFTTMPGITPIPVGMFTPAQGVALLTEATGDRDTDAANVGQHLGWLPLGLAQAAAYMVLNQLSYQQYLQKVATVALEEVLLQQAGAGHPGVLKATALSIDSIHRADPTGHAHRLLTVLAVLAPEGISRFLLTSRHAMTALDLDDTTLSMALRVLANASLITLAQRDEPDRHSGHERADYVVVAVHRLTATVVRHHTGPQALSQAIETATAMIDTLTDNLPLSQVAHRRRELDELVTHLQALHQHSPQPTETLLNNSDWAGQALESAGRLDEAVTLFERTLTDYERVLGLDHLHTLAARHNLAGAYESAGRLNEAITLFQQTLADFERVLGADNPHTLAARHNLAYTYRSARRLDEAIILYHETLIDFERVHGADHPHTVALRDNLANAYKSAGRLDEALAMHEQSLADFERVLGADHLDTLTSRHNLASTYVAAGRLDEALAMHEQNLADRQRVLGADHPDTLASRHDLAYTYRSAGRLNEAILLYQQALADYERALGTDHPDTLVARNNLAIAYAAVGRLDEAVAMHEQNLADRQRVLGADHPDTLASHHNLAYTYQSAGRDDEAITLFERALVDGERVLGADHPDTLIARENLADAHEVLLGLTRPVS